MVNPPTNVYARMSEVLGITDDNHVLETFMAKIVTNLKCWGRCEPVISRTLQFLNDLSVGYPFYCTSRVLVNENNVVKINIWKPFSIL
ncbi:integrin alpha-4 [Platysternon megacephalum]|uniref:Integrin alpha-4 n=1 Tax=Platysternon megacephalum TaxID=55544 RepID=A0A4D9FA70_9SAUR|nr:integrin alpha-4 [Platysternon megacephalum]